MRASIVILLVVSLEFGSAYGRIDGRSAHAGDVIRARGFIAEEYKIQTKGGVPLTLHRIINPLANQNTLNKYPVLYGHGVLYDSQSMISRSEHSRPRKPVIGRPTINYGNAIDGTDDTSLPFMFSNNNFDVWLYDARGTNDDNRNISSELPGMQSNHFWDFSLDDQGLVDLPLLMDFVLSKTASTKLVYVAYSESTFFMFALLSSAPHYKDKVAAFVAMAPVAYVSAIKGMTLPALSALSSWVPDSVNYALLPQPMIDTVDVTLRNLCVKDLGQLLCRPIVNSIAGKGSGAIAPTFFNNFFKSTSLKAIKHFLQLFKSKRFGMYDYGDKTNMEVYGSPVPPRYDLSRIRSDRIILVRGLADFLSTPEDQHRLITELGCKPYLDIVIPHYNHFDFVDGKDIVRLINGPAMTAVYELMYKDGPNILKTPEQIRVNQNIRPQLEQRLAENSAMAQSNVNNGLDLLNFPSTIISSLTGNSGIFNPKFLLGA